jgi:hypothetical protein
MQHFLKALAGAAWAQVVPSQLFSQVFITVDDPVTFLTWVSEGNPLRRLLLRVKGG